MFALAERPLENNGENHGEVVNRVRGAFGWGMTQLAPLVRRVSFVQLTTMEPQAESSRTLHFDCLSGISGDMTLGALIDLGVSADAIQTGLQSLNLPNLGLRASEVKKCGFRAVQITIEHPPEKAHRHLHHIEDMIDAATAISDNAKSIAKSIFRCVGEAEAKVHGCTIRQVHFHEVGAIDSIADIVGVAIAVDALGVTHASSSPIPTGTGSIVIDHGRVSIPAPATAEILCGVPLAACDIESELTTPTGAAIVKTLAQSFGPPPPMIAEAVGYGAGTRDLPGQANVLRVTLGRLIEPATAMGRIESDQVTLLETNLDDADPQTIAGVATRLLAAGALDVWQTPCVMKKGRLGTVLSVLCGSSRIGALQAIILTQTSSIGVRRQTLSRGKLARESVTIETPHGPARGKVAVLPDGSRRFKLEDDEAQRLAQSTGKTTMRIHADAIVTFEQSDVAGAP